MNVGSSTELASKIMQISGRYAKVRAQLIDIHRAMVNADFRHASLHCTCAICQDIRRAFPHLIKRTGEILESIEASEASEADRPF
jgi:queuine/archaeosine tRNA-ribosyltransferase